MARPKRMKKPARLNLLIDEKSKKMAFKLASERDMSIGRLFEILLTEASAQPAQQAA